MRYFYQRLEICAFILAALGIVTPRVYAQAPPAGGAKSKGTAIAANAAVTNGATPEEVAKAFVEAGNKEDVNTLFALMTTKAREAIQPKEGEENLFKADKGKFKDPVIGTARIEGDLAKVPIETTGDEGRQTQILQMRKDVWERRRDDL